MKFISWNARGMNSVAKRAVMKDVLTSAGGAFFFFQETKMEVIDEKVIRSLCALQNFNFVFCPSKGVFGGVLLFWNSDMWPQVGVHIGLYSVSVLVKDVRRSVEWVASSIYGPCNSSKDRRFGLNLIRWQVGGIGHWW